MSPATCRNAARVLRPFASPRRPNTTTELIAMPISAVTTTIEPWTSCGAISRRTASKPIASTMTINVSAFSSAARIVTR